jgi:hypothetical protein
LEPETTQQSGQTPDKEVEIKNITAATLKPTRLERYLPRLSGDSKVRLFRADSLARCLLQWMYCFFRIYNGVLQ